MYGFWADGRHTLSLRHLQHSRLLLAHSQPDPEFPGGKVPITLGSPSLEKEPETESGEWARSTAALLLWPGCGHVGHRQNADHPGTRPPSERFPPQSHQCTQSRAQGTQRCTLVCTLSPEDNEEIRCFPGATNVDFCFQPQQKSLKIKLFKIQSHVARIRGHAVHACFSYRSTTY